MTNEEIEANLNRIELAIYTLAWWLVQAQTGFSEKDAAGVVDILWGKNREFARDAT